MKKVFRSAALLLLCTTVYAQDITQTMSMNLQNVTLKEFFKNLEAQTSFSVVYRDVILSEDADVVVSASNRQLKDILSQVLEKYGLSYKVSNKTIVIVKAEAQAPVKNQKAKKIGGVSKLAHLFLCTRPRLSQAGALLLPKNYVSLGIYFYYVKDTFSSLQSQPNSAFSSKN